MTTEHTLEEATAALIQSDPDLREDLRALIKEAISRYRHTIRWGQPDARLSAIKAIVPGMMRAMGKVELAESDRKMRLEYDALVTATGFGGVQQEIVVTPEAEVVVKKATRTHKKAT